MKLPKVVVLVLSYNGKHLLGEAISSYLESDYGNFEVVVVDNGSIDGTRDYVRAVFPGTGIVRTDKNLGYSGGLNFGMHFAFNERAAEYVLISNNDVMADTKAISELVKVTEIDRKIGFVTGKVYYYDKPNTFQTVGKKEDAVKWNGGHIGNREEDNGQYDEVCERYFADDIYMLVSRELYEDTGGYNTLFYLQSEDYDWQARAKNLGYKIMYTPYAKLWHKESMTIGKTSALKAYYDARNPMLVILLHKTPQFFKRYLRYHLCRNIIRGSLVSLKQGNVTKALAKWQGFFSGIGWGFTYRKFSLRHFF